MPKNAFALKKIAGFSYFAVALAILAGLASTQAAAAAATAVTASPVLSEPHRAFCRAPGLSWSLILDFDKFDAGGNDGESEISFLSNQVSDSASGQLARDASYHVVVRKVAQFPEVDFDSYRAVFGEESSNFILNLPRDRKGKSIVTRAYLSTDGQTQSLACSVSLREPDALNVALARDLDRKRAESKIAESKLPPQVCAIDYLDEKTNAYEFGCSATIVSPRDLLTAGHCQQIYRGKPARARCPGQPTIAIDLKNSIHHEKHVEDMWKVSYDIAMLRLSQPVSTTPAEIASNSESVRQSIFEHPESCALYGYGRELDGHIGRLHGVRFEFPPDDLGGRAFSESNFADEHMISTDPRLFLRGGDSGGPILCGTPDAPVVVGVHSILFALDSSANSSSVGFNAAWIHSHLYDESESEPRQDAVSTKLAVQAAADDVDAPNSLDDNGTAPIHVDKPLKVDTNPDDDAPIVESSDD